MSRPNQEPHDSTLRPYQHYTGNRPVAPDEGERRLMVAVLEDAFACLRLGIRGRVAHGQDLLAETRGWFASDDATHLYSLRSICTYLDVEPEAIRAHAKRVEWTALKERAHRRATQPARRVLAARAARRSGGQ